MGTGASLLVLPEDLVEGLTTLQRRWRRRAPGRRRSARPWSDLLEHSRGVYEKRIDEARAHCEDLQKLRSDAPHGFQQRLYSSPCTSCERRRTASPTSTPRANRCASNAPQEKPRQETQQLDELYEAGAVSARAPFASLLDAAQQTFSRALKSRWRR